MKKYIPIIILLLGIIVIAAVLIMSRGKGNKEPLETGNDNDSTVTEVKFSKRPYISLTPSLDGHWLTLKVDKIAIDATTMDYELLYKAGDGRTLGVPGSIKLEDQNSIERKLLLGSESSGKFRYDDGVEEGTITLRFRNEKGKLVAKFQSDFTLKNGEKEYSSKDGVALFVLQKIVPDYFVVMNTVGLPDDKTEGVKIGPYGIYSSIQTSVDMKIDLKNSSVLYYDDGELKPLNEGTTKSLGIFASN